LIADTTDRVGISEAAKPAVPFVAGLASLTAVLGAAGVAEGVVPRMVGETPVSFGLALFCIVLAGFLTVIAGLVTRSKLVELVSLIASNILLLVGLGFGIIGAVKVWSETRVPSVTADEQHTRRGTFLRVAVRGSGLGSQERITLRVERLAYGDGKAGRQKGQLYGAGTPFYSASLGSDDDGKLNHVARVRLPPGFSGLFGVRAHAGALPKGCYSGDSSDGCITGGIYPDGDAPQLRVHWRRRYGVLVVRVRARGGPERVWMRAMAQRSGKRRWRELATWRLPPGANGNFARRLRLPGLAGMGRLCVVASTARRETCPPQPDAERIRTAWVRYRATRP